jgi:hypothetical protein
VRWVNTKTGKLGFQPQVAQHVHAIEFGQVQIQNHPVVFGFVGPSACQLAVRKYVHCVVFGFETLAEKLGRLPLSECVA